LLIALLMRDWRMLAPVAGAAMLLSLAGQLQRGLVDAQPFFSLLSDAHRKIQQTRAPYNWLGLWLPRYYFTFAITCTLAVLAERRVRRLLPPAVQPYFQWLPWIGLATIPLSFLLLENLGWALFPQLQPMRALLYCHLLCQWLGAIVAMVELRDGRWLRAALWLLVPLSLALRGDFLLFTEQKIISQAALAGLIALACWLGRRHAAVFLVLPVFLVWQGDGAPPRLESAELTTLSHWARASTGKDDVFFFPDLGRKPEPGIFRARAARAVYVCWKQGGQVNYFAAYADKWWERWSQLLAKGHAAIDYDDLRSRGIDFLILTKDQPKEALPEVFRTPGGGYRVYRLMRL
jgi:hypothetical protein